nr:MAG TPA: hypothetical protein [Caudoviricetes sp.]
MCIHLHHSFKFYIIFILSYLTDSNLHLNLLDNLLYLN